MPGLERLQERLKSVPFIIARELYLANKNRQHAEHQQRLFEERVTRAEALARGLGVQRRTFGPIEWWFDGEDNFAGEDWKYHRLTAGNKGDCLDVALAMGRFQSRVITLRSEDHLDTF